MFSIDKQRTSENLLYILLWSVIFFVPAFHATMTSQELLRFDDILAAWFKTSPFFAIFLVNNNFLVHNLLFKREYLFYAALTLLFSIVVFIGIDYIQENMMSRFLARRVIDDLVDDKISITDVNIFWNVFFAMMMCAANDGIKLIYKSMRDDQLMEELKRQNLQVQMDYLKYQVNPHFFMNTLNNIHALIDIDPDSAKDAVIDLSKMMRYVLYESGSESISLSQDMKFISNYIELMRIRYDDSIKITFKTADNLPVNAVIPPLILIVFIENAFKHGVGCSHSESFIDVDISYQAPYLHYRVANSVAPKSVASSSTGIGLVNLRKRLELIYANKFKINYECRDGVYTASLIILIDNAKDDNNR